MPSPLLGLLTGYMKGQGLKKQQDLQDKERKAALNLLDAKLSQMQKQQGAQQSLLDMVAGTPAKAPVDELSPAGVTTNVSPAEPAAAPKSLSDILADPQGQLLAMQSGMIDGKDLMKRDSMNETLSRLGYGSSPESGAMPAAMPNSGTPGTSPQGGIPQDFGMSGFKIGPSGEFMPDFARRKVSRMVTMGNEQVALDEQGTPMATYPLAPSQRPTEAVPLSGTDLANFVDETGNNPPAGSTLQDVVVSKKFKVKGQQVPSSESARLAFTNEGAGIMHDIIGKIQNPDGSINTATILQMNAPGGGIGPGRELRQRAETAISGQLLLLSGVAVRPEEKENLMNQFVPNLLDLTSPGLVVRKMENLKRLMEGELDMASLPASIRERVIERRKKEADKGGSSAPASSKVVDFKDLP